MKAGFDVRRSTSRASSSRRSAGCSGYATLDAFVNDVAEAANINKPLPGGEEVNYYRWWDQYYFVQDEWKRPADLDAQPRPALRAAGQQHPEPDRAQRGDPARPTATIRSTGSIRSRRPTRTTSSRGSASTGRRAPTRSGVIGLITGGDDFVAARRLRADERLRVPQHRAEHRQLVPVCRGHQPQQPRERVHAAAGHAGGRSGRDEPELPDAHRRRRGLPRADRRSVQPRSSASARAEPGVAVGYVGTFGQGSVPDARRQPASAVLRQPVHDRPARRSERAASSACAPTRPNPGITRCRPASTSG